MSLNQTNQVIHCQVTLLSENKSFYCSIIYAGNKVDQRKSLWDSLCLHKRFVSLNPWVLLGDFNVTLNIEDHSLGSSGITKAMVEFKDCIEAIDRSRGY